MRIFRHYVSSAKVWLVLVDSVMVQLSFFLAVTLRQYSTITFGLEAQEWLTSFSGATVLILVLISVGGYTNESLRDFRVLFVRLIVSFFAVFFILSGAFYLLKLVPLWRSSLIFSLLVSSAVLLTNRLVLSHLFLKRFPRRIIVFGAGLRGKRIAELLMEHSELGMKLVGVLKTTEEETDLEGAEILGDANQITRFFYERKADLIIIASDNDLQGFDLPEFANSALVTASIFGIEIKDYRGFMERVSGQVMLDSMKAETFIFRRGLQAGELFSRAVKRVLDLVIALSLLLITLPFSIGAGILIKLSSKGPVFYKQIRVGRGGRPFALLKFRSMRQGAEQDNGPSWASHNDPRITKIGRFLRKTRIDELPQLFNVFLGHMSMVGPRPERPFFVEKLEHSLPFYSVRHYVKPGITGWAQIRFPYGASLDDAARKLEYDLYYIKNYSLFLDLLIIMQTVRVILFPNGAR